jgi:Flp pilus assembly protein TadG
MDSEILANRKSNKGQSLVEFALILPLLILILIGVFDLGRALFALITINNAAREGARYGTLHTDETVDMIQAAAVAEAQGQGVDVNLGDVSVTCPDDGATWPCNRGTAVRVTVDYAFDPIIGVILPATINIQRFNEMAVP